MANVLLIKTSRLREHEQVVTCSLGLLYLASHAEQHGHRVEVLDLRTIPAKDLGIAIHEHMRRGVQVAGFSALSSDARVLRMTSAFIRAHYPDVLQVAGGPGPSSDSGDYLRRTQCDLLVLNEGEATFSEILARVDAGRDWRDVQGIAYLGADGGVVHTSARDLWPNLDALPNPAWHLHDFDTLARFPSMSIRDGRRAEIQTSRGCPFMCSYCHSFMGKQFRARSPGHVLAEMHHLRNVYGVRRFDFVDDIFNWDRERAKVILQGIRDELPDCQLAFPNAIRGDILDEELIRLFAEANTIYMIVAVETASQRLNRETRKNLNHRRLYEALNLFHKYHVYTGAYFMVGFPGETDDEREATFHLAETLPLDLPHVSVVTPYRGTEMWDCVGEEFAANADVEILDPLLGWGDRNFTDQSNSELRKRAERLYLRALKKPQNWYAAEVALRWHGVGRAVVRGLTRGLPPALRDRVNMTMPNPYTTPDLSALAAGVPAAPGPATTTTLPGRIPMRYDLASVRRKPRPRAAPRRATTAATA